MRKKKIIFHIDVNNAFLSWTAVKLLNEGYPTDIRTIPAVIGGDEEKRHGIVLAKSYPAKKMGVITTETLYSARKKIPNIKILAPDFDFYKKKSNEFFSYLSKFTPDIEIYSIDECFMDMSGCTLMYKDLLALAYEIKDTIYSKFGFTVNIGIGNNKLCAKMASDFEKPNKVHTLYEFEIQKKMWPLDVNDLFMVGKKSAIKLKEYGFNTIGDIAQSDINFMKKKFRLHGVMIWEYSNGIDNSDVVTEREQAKSISISQTLESDIDNLEIINNLFLKQSSSIARTLRKQKKYALVVAISIKTFDFNIYIKQEKLINAINSDIDIYNSVKKLFDKYWNGNKIRSIGIRLGELVDSNNYQTSIFDNPIKSATKNDNVIDKIRDKYGEEIIMPASLLQKSK